MILFKNDTEIKGMIKLDELASIFIHKIAFS